MIKLENRADKSDGKHKQARDDIDELMAKMSAIENKNAMKDIIAEGNMDGNSMDRILKAIEDMQARINADTDAKLANYVTQPVFDDAETELKSTGRRVGYNEGILKD